MLFIVGVLIVFFGVCVSIALHEIGHLIPAKKFGLRVPQYMVGFGPSIFSKRVGETEYGLKAIPLGGYIRMIGMFPPRPGDDPNRLRPSSTGRFSQLAEQARAESMEEVGPGDENRVFYRLPAWKRIIIMMGGPLMNLVLAFVLFTVALSGIGTPGATTTLSATVPCMPVAGQPEAPETCDDSAAAPAAAAGLREGDTIVAVNGQGTSSWGQTTHAIQNAPGSQMTVTVERDGQRTDITVPVKRVERAKVDETGAPITNDAGEPVIGEVGFLGARPGVAYERLPLTESVKATGDGLVQTAKVFVKIPEKMVGVFRAAFGGAERDAEGPVSVVGVGRVAGDVTAGNVPLVDEGWQSKALLLVSLLAALNMALFIFNLIPLLPLDGGHVAGALWESIKKAWARLRGLPDPGPVDVAKALPVAYAVSITLIGMAVLLIYADLVNPISLTGG